MQVSVLKSGILWGRIGIREEEKYDPMKCREVQPSGKGNQSPEEIR
jgi:hypothetical protein